MKTTRLAGLAVVLALLLPAAAAAHEGHAHKVLGTVTMIADDHVMMKTTDGKDVTIAINADTKIVRGKTAVKAADIKVGSRLVVTLVSDKEPLVAKEVQAGTAAAKKPAVAKTVSKPS